MITFFFLGDDFTFSKQLKGKQIPYGTAGDCYSSIKGCAQGSFSVDLTHTSFKLAKNVKWEELGTYASAAIHKTVSFKIDMKHFQNSKTYLGKPNFLGSTQIWKLLMLTLHFKLKDSLQRSHSNRFYVSLKLFLDIILFYNIFKKLNVKVLIKNK